MSISIGVGRLPLSAAVVAGAFAAGSAEAAVRVYAVNWSLPASGELYVSLNNLTTGPVTSSSSVSGWDMRISSPSARSSLDFSFPAPTVPGPITNPNPYYGIMRAPGDSLGGGASLPVNTMIMSSSSFADGGAMAFGSGAYQWRLNGENYFGFRMRLGTSQSLVYGWARMVIGSTPGQFTLTHFAYQDVAGASLRVGEGMPIPGPGAIALFGAAALAGRRRRR
jgi:MYXO-CTERM domain-containing protein